MSCMVGKMRITVDLTLCQGYAQCCFLAPDVFQLAGEEALVYVPESDEHQRLGVTRAAAACPVGAILVDIEEHDGRPKGSEPQ
jgi:ferredoxin